MSMLDNLFSLLSIDLLVLFLAGGVATMVAALLAPLGPLRWWAGWSTRRPWRLVGHGEVPQVPTPVTAEHFIVYLSGIGEAEPGAAGAFEFDFLERLSVHLPRCVIIHDLFSYAVDNVGLTEEHWLGGFWRWVHQSQVARGRRAVLGNLINLRNLLQVLVSADRRYGPLYSWGTAGVIVKTLQAHGYPIGSGTPITMIGYSGGAQIALGAARYLGPALGAPIQLVAVGGVMSADPGLANLEALYQLLGTHDPVPGYGAAMFAGRWPVARRSPWNRARTAGHIHQIVVGPARHNGGGSYFDPLAGPPERRILDQVVLTTSRLVMAMIVQHRAPTSVPGPDMPSPETH